MCILVDLTNWNFIGAVFYLWKLSNVLLSVLMLIARNILIGVVSLLVILGSLMLVSTSVEMQWLIGIALFVRDTAYDLAWNFDCC